LSGVVEIDSTAKVDADDLVRVVALARGTVLPMRPKPVNSIIVRHPFFEENQPISNGMEPLGTLPFAVSRQNGRNWLQKSAKLHFLDCIIFESRTFLAERRNFRNEKGSELLTTYAETTREKPWKVAE
jgi:hypothetical protein